MLRCCILCWPNSDIRIWEASGSEQMLWILSTWSLMLDRMNTNSLTLMTIFGSNSLCSTFLASFAHWTVVLGAPV